VRRTRAARLQSQAPPAQTQPEEEEQQDRAAEALVPLLELGVLVQVVLLENASGGALAF
jgi:hypothetical protein